jgi:predicted permease
VLDDIRYAVRSVRRRPLLAIAAIVTLALGIGGTTAVFTVVDAVILQALPFREPERLVRVWELTRDGDRFSVPAPTYLEIARTSRTLQPVAAYRDPVREVLEVDGRAQHISVVRASASFTEVLSVPPRLGPMFTRADDQPNAAARPLIIADGLWRTHFNAAEDVIGRVVNIDGNPYHVAGVMPQGFDFPGTTDAWIPLGADPAADRGDKELAVIARLAPGATHAQVAGELREMASRWSQQFPESYGGWSAEAVPFPEWVISPRYRDAVWVVFGAVTLLLLLACANVANLLLAQAMSRQGEMRVRTALGAQRGRLVRQLFVEACVIAALATIIGALIAVWSIDAVRAFSGGVLPRLDALAVNGRVLMFACAAGLISCVTFGLVPAAHATRVDLRFGVEEGFRYTARSHGARHGLVIVEVALAMLLLIGAGLLANSFVRLLNVDPGFDVATTYAIPLAIGSIETERAPEHFYADLIDRVRSIPGVTGVGATATNPFRQYGFSNSVTPVERAGEAPASGLIQAGWRSVTPGFFDAMRVPIIAGRPFADHDQDGSERVVILSQSLAQRLWPGESAVDKRIYWGGVSGTPRTVVGVVGDIRDVQLDAQATPLVFVPHAQVPIPDLTLIVRSSEPLDRLAPLLRQTVRESGAKLTPPVYPLSDSRRTTTLAPRFSMALLVGFAVVALTLALIGVYALLAFVVSERRREMAVRIALGASSASITRAVLRSGLTLSLTGAACGIAAAVVATQTLSRLLYDVTPTDPVTYMAATAVLVLAAAFASYLPARQAARVDAAAVLNRT